MKGTNLLSVETTENTICSIDELHQTHPDPGGQLSAQRAHKQVRETNPLNSSNAKHIYQLPKDLVFLSLINNVIEEYFPPMENQLSF